MVMAFDSEFLISGAKRKDGDVQVISFDDGLGDPLVDPYPLNESNKHTFVFESPEEVREFIRSRRRTLKTVYAFVSLCDIGSLKSWLPPLNRSGRETVQTHKVGARHSANVRYSGAKFRIVDAHTLLKSFGFNRLYACGDWLGIPKLVKPDFLGIRDPETTQERIDFIRYAARDAVVTSRIVEWIINKYDADPAKLVSSGTLAKQYFHFPRRLSKVGTRYKPTAVEQFVKSWTFAGRNEVFQNGLTRNCFYNDIASLYPCSMALIRAFMIKSYQKCKFSDLDVTGNLDITEESETRFGWISGVFETNNDLWGLPMRGERNYFMTGRIQGLYNTFDIGAAKAKVLFANRCYRPIFRDDRKSHDKMTSMLLEKLEGRCNEVRKKFIKSVLNSASGKLGQAKPVPAATSNYLAYNLLLGHSHLIMSKCFDHCLRMGGRILGMDTDSVFSDVKIQGEMFKVKNCYGTEIPILMDVKASGDLAFWRSKRYIIWNRSKLFDMGKNPAYARAGWHYPAEDFIKLFDADLDELRTRMDIKHTLLTRTKEAHQLLLGHWRTKPKTLDLEKIKKLLVADDKRDRGAESNYDSYQLVRDKRSVASHSWNFDKILEEDRDKFGFNQGMLRLRRWVKNEKKA